MKRIAILDKKIESSFQANAWKNFDLTIATEEVDAPIRNVITLESLLKGISLEVIPRLHPEYFAVDEVVNVLINQLRHSEREMTIAEKEAYRTWLFDRFQTQTLGKWGFITYVLQQNIKAGDEVTFVSDAFFLRLALYFHLTKAGVHFTYFKNYKQFSHAERISET